MNNQVEGLGLAWRGAPSSMGSCPLPTGLADRGDLLRLFPLLALRLLLRDRDTDLLPPGLLLRLRLPPLLDLHPYRLEILYTTCDFWDVQGELSIFMVLPGIS